MSRDEVQTDIVRGIHVGPEAYDVSQVFVELGLVILGLAVLARFANRMGFSAIPLYLLAGLAFGKGGLLPLKVSAEFTHIGAEIGLLLLFMLGLEYTGEELKEDLKTGFRPGLLDFVLNFTPGLVMGLLLRWGVIAALVLGGITYISSSGIIAKVLGELNRLNNPETPSIISVLVMEDLAMAVYLPMIAVLLAGGGARKIIFSVTIATVTVAMILLVALRFGRQISAFFLHESDEILLLTVFGVVILVGGLAHRFQVSAAIGAFLVGIALSGPIAEKSRTLIGPLRDLFAATFFFFFGLQIDPRSLPSVMPLVLAIGIVSALTKVLTGYWAARRAGLDQRARMRAGMTLVTRGEFSIVIAGLRGWSHNWSLWPPPMCCSWRFWGRF
jgi:CPA2 family monovalent cation:H+ antiporter-2